MLLSPSDAAAPTSYPSDGGIAVKIQPFIDQNVIPGAVILVANKDGVLDLETVGYSDIENKIPMDVGNLFMIASMVKTVTAVGLMMLVDEGKIHLEDPVEKYLPAFKGQMVAEKDDPSHPHPPQHPITIREVMSHTSGVHSGRPNNPVTVVDAANQIARQALDWEPGSKYVYGQGPLIGGAIIEVARGVPYPQFIQQRILDPLGMKDTTFWPDAKQAARLALTGKYNPATQKLENLHQNDKFLDDPSRLGSAPPRVLSQMPLDLLSDYKNHYARPDGGWFSTALDMSQFGRMLLNGGAYGGKKYITPGALKEMATIQTKDLFPGKTEGYGIGTVIQRNHADDGPAVGSFGHRGSRKTMFWIDPHDNLVLIFMTQRTEDPTEEQQKALNASFIRTAIEKYGRQR